MAETKNDAFPHGAARFLGQLRRNNRKDWFDVHREEYERLVLEPAKEFVIELGAGLRKLRPKLQVDPRTNYGVKRINRDVRFARDKRPYKDHQTLWWWEGAAKDPAPGYWFDLTPTRAYLGVGWYMIEPAMLPSPPLRLPPPITTAAMMSRSAPLATVGSPCSGACPLPPTSSRR